MSSSILKKLAIVTSVLLALLVVYFYRQVPHVRKPFFSATSVTQKITLAQAAQKVELTKSGGSWSVILSSHTPQPADPGKVKTLLTDLHDFQLEDEISDRPDHYPDYEVDPSSGIQVSLWGAQGKLLATGIIGKQARDFVHSYFRYPNQAQVYLARGLELSDLGKITPNDWRDHVMFNVG